MSSSNEMNLEENESNSELFDLHESHSFSFNNDGNNSSYSHHNSSSNNLVIANNNNSFKNMTDKKFNSSSNSLTNNLTSNAKQSNIENKKNLLLSVNGNQVCCDCGASNPSWVNKNFFLSFEFLKNDMVSTLVQPYRECFNPQNR